MSLLKGNAHSTRFWNRDDLGILAAANKTNRLFFYAFCEFNITVVVIVGVLFVEWNFQKISNLNQICQMKHVKAIFSKNPAKKIQIQFSRHVDKKFFWRVS